MKAQPNLQSLLCLCLCALGSGSAAALSAAPAAPAAALSLLAQEEEPPKPDKRPEIKEALDQLKDFISNRKGEQDHDAISLIDRLLTLEFEQSGPRDRKAIVKSLSDCLKVKRQVSNEGIRDNKLFLAAAAALGGMGPESSKELQSWINHKTHRQDLSLQRQLILSLGKLKDEKAIKFLIDLLMHPAPEVQAAGAEALSNYDGSEQATRKDIFEEVLKVLGGAKTNVDQDVNDTVARERYDIIEASMITTLQTMSGQDLRDPADWQHWWNKNKREDWDEKA